MIRVHITSKDGAQYWLDFSSREEADAYKEQVRQSAHWGKPAWTEIVEIQPELKDPETGEITPAITQTIEHPAEYQIVEEDISLEVAAKEKKNKDKQDLELEVESLKSKSGNFSTAELTKIARLLLLK